MCISDRNDLLKAVKGGKALSQAMQPYQQVFGTFYLSMVRAGEASGQLAEVLSRLVEYLENAKENRDTVISALIYPAILAVVSVLSIVIMLGFVVPQFETLFDDMGDALPMVTQMVIGSADFIKSYGLIVLVLLVAAEVVFVVLLVVVEVVVFVVVFVVLLVMVEVVVCVVVFVDSVLCLACLGGVAMSCIIWICVWTCSCGLC